jgi:hypothetical protein
MGLTRRSLLALWGCATRGVVGAALVSRLLGKAHAAGDSGRTLRVYVDTLIPADELGPGALELGVLEAIEAAAAQDAGYRRLLDLGCAWLDQQAGFFGEKAFGALGENQRARLVLFASEQAFGSVPRVFFEMTQAHALRLFWARPEAWPAIGYGGPPQPAGFIDYAEPPAA